MATKEIFPKDKKKTAKSQAKNKEPESEQPIVSHGPLRVIHIDKPGRRVYVGVDQEKSTSRIEELQSEDAKHLALVAASKEGIVNPSVMNQPSLAYFSRLEKKPVSAALGDREDVELCLEVEVTSFGSESGFVGDSTDVFPS